MQMEVFFPISHAKHLQICFCCFTLFTYLRRNDILSPASTIVIKELVLQTLVYCTVSSEQEPWCHFDLRAFAASCLTELLERDLAELPLK